MNTHTLSADTQATLLLCGRLGQKAGSDQYQPLMPAEYRSLAHWLFTANKRPGDLLQAEERQQLYAEPDSVHGLASERIEYLLGRGAALALAVEGWTNKGLWVMSRSDAAYPQTLRERLKQAAPPILYGAGEPTLLCNEGMVIVGSRDVDAAGIQATQTLAAQCAHQQIAVISGGARGVDRVALYAALSAGGNAVGMLADSLAKAAVDRTYRDAIRDGRLVLVSPYDPYAGFNVGYAMERNKSIYALGAWACVISSAYQKGGTWAGAIEQLDRYHWFPIYVRNGSDVPQGNRALIERGGIAWDVDRLTDECDLRDWLTHHATRQHEVDSTASQPNDERPVSHDLFGVVWPYLAQELQTPQTIDQLKRVFDHVLVPQLHSWLKHAKRLGKVQSAPDGAYVVRRTGAGTDEAGHTHSVAPEHQLSLFD